MKQFCILIAMVVTQFYTGDKTAYTAIVLMSVPGLTLYYIVP